MFRSDLAALLSARAKDATSLTVVGKRQLWQRRIVTAVGVSALMALTLHQTVEMGQLMAADPLGPPPPFQIQIPAPYTEVAPPAEGYRVEVIDVKDARTVTSVHMDPTQWSDQEQRTFMRKLVGQADQRAASTNQVYEIHAYATNGEVQMQAQRFLRQAIQDAGIATQAANGKTDSEASTGRIPGLRFAMDESPQSLNRLGSDPCVVAGGDDVGCIHKDATSGSAAASPRRRRHP